MKDLCQVLEAGENMTVSKYHFLHTDSFHLRRKTNLNKGMQCFNSSIHYLRQSKCTLPALSLKELVINLEIALKTNYACLDHWNIIRIAWISIFASWFSSEFSWDSYFSFEGLSLMTDNSFPQDRWHFLALFQILWIQYKFLGPKTTAAPSVLC